MLCATLSEKTSGEPWMFCFLAPSSLSQKDLSFGYFKTDCETSHVSSLSERLQNTNGCSECALSDSKISKAEGLRVMFCVCHKTSKVDPCSGFLWFLSLYEVSLQYSLKWRLHILIFSLIEWLNTTSNATNVPFLPPRLQKADAIRLCSASVSIAAYLL
jgi:hypothetical protein